MPKNNDLIKLGFSVLVSLLLFSGYGYAEDSNEAPLRKGVSYGWRGQYDQAIAEFDKVIAADPGSVAAYYDRGVVYDRKGDRERAIADYSKVIELDPNSADAYYNRGAAYYKKGAFDKALSDFTRSIELDRGSADAYYGRALIYTKKNNLDKAIPEYDKAIELDPDFALAYTGRAVAYVTKKNYLKSLSDVNKAAAIGFRPRPLKQPPSKEPEKIISAPAPAEKPPAAAAKIVSAIGERDPKKAALWRARRQTARIRFYALVWSLIACLIVILALIRANRTMKKVPGKKRARRGAKR